MKHTDELTLQRLTDGELTPERVHAARTHLIECARCQSTHESMKAETELLRSALRGSSDESIPEAIAPRTDMSWVLVACLLVIVLGVSAYWGQIPTEAASQDESTSLVTRLLIRGVLFRGWSAVVGSVSSLITLLVVLVAAVASLRWAWKRLRSSPASLLMLGLLASSGVAVESKAAEVQRVHEYTLEAADRVENDLIVVAERVQIRGVVAGDLIVLADSLVVSGTVEGDLIGFADSIELRSGGRVAGSIRTASVSLDLEGEVRRNVLAASIRSRLARGGHVLGSFTGASMDRLTLEGRVDRDVTAAAERQTLDGPVGGSARLTGRVLSLGPGTEIAGETRFRGAEEPEVHADAALASPLRYERDEPSFELDLEVPPVTRFVFFWAAAFLFGAPLLLLAPDVATAVTTVHLPARGKSLLVGLVALVTLVCLALISMITLIGGPLSLLLIVTLTLGLYAAQAYVGAYLAREFLGQPASTGERLGHLALGLLAIHAAGSLPVVGTVVTVGVALFGFGGIMSWALDRMTPPSAAPVAVPSAPN